MAFDCYLKIPTIDGEATSEGFEKWIQCLSYSHGVNQHSGGSMSGAGGLSGGRAELQAFTFTHHLDKSSPKIALSCCTGEHLKDVVVKLRRSTGDGTPKVFMEFKMTEAIISSARVAGSSSGGEVLPLEEVSFSYGKIEWDYTEIDQAGKEKGHVKTGWDVAKNKKV